MKDTKKRLILLLAVIVMWTGILIYDIQENAHILMIIADVFVVIFIGILCLLSPHLPAQVKSLQQVENEIVEIENSKKST